MTQPEDSNEPDEPSAWVYRNPILFLAASAFVALGLFGLWGWWMGSSHAPLERGTFGDSFAPVVGLVTAAALASAVLSTFLQREELRLQRREQVKARTEAEAHTQATNRLAIATESAAAAADVANELSRQHLRSLEASRAASLRSALATAEGNLLTAQGQLAATITDGVRLNGGSKNNWDNTMRRARAGEVLVDESGRLAIYAAALESRITRYEADLAELQELTIA